MAFRVIEPEIEAPLPGKWCALSPGETSETAARLPSGNGAVLTNQTQESVAGYLFTKKSPDGWLTFVFGYQPDERRAVVERRYPFTLTFHADNGGTRMQGNGEGRGLDAVAWAADQIVAAAPARGDP